MKPVMTIFTTIAATALYALPAQAALVTADVDQIAAVLQKEGYQAKRGGDGDSPHIETAMGGYKTTIYFYGCNEKGKECESVQFYAGFITNEKGPDLNAMNEYARLNRWGRVYLDHDDDPVIEMDLDLEVGGMSEALFMDNIAYWTTILSKFADFALAERTTEEESSEEVSTEST